MATQSQIEANRRNAQKSTGPRSEEGKQTSARNATKFGLFSRHVLLPGDDEAEFEPALSERSVSELSSPVTCKPLRI